MVKMSIVLQIIKPLNKEQKEHNKYEIAEKIKPTANWKTKRFTFKCCISPKEMEKRLKEFVGFWKEDKKNG